jgi:hypothetical protein
LFWTGVAVVNSLGGSDGIETKGTALGLGSKMVLLAKDDGYTIAHELGHAKFSLIHPDHTYDANGNKINDGQFGIADWFNFMHSPSENVPQGKVRVNNVRRYQFDLIRKED